MGRSRRHLQIMQVKASTRRKWLSVALGFGLAVASLGTVSAQQQTTTTTTRSTASDREAYNEFLERTAAEWSEAGYSSAEQMRQTEGGEWYTEMRAQFGGGTGTEVADETTNQVDQNGRAFGGAFGEGQLEDDESNGSVVSGNDSQGSENENEANASDEDADEADGGDEDADEADSGDEESDEADAGDGEVSDDSEQ
jgi:hypothetical protein